jgi:hypothetical protein
MPTCFGANFAGGLAPDAPHRGRQSRAATRAYGLPPRRHRHRPTLPTLGWGQDTQARRGQTWLTNPVVGVIAAAAWIFGWVRRAGHTSSSLRQPARSHPPLPDNVCTAVAVPGLSRGPGHPNEGGRLRGADPPIGYHAAACLPATTVPSRKYACDQSGISVYLAGGQEHGGMNGFRA